jgi:hypothetical protein
MARLTADFYAWEERGRGWRVWPYPVALEPPFRPFISHATSAGPTVDDARKPSWLHRWLGRLTGRNGFEHDVNLDEVDVDEPDAEPGGEPGSIVEIQIALSPETKVAPELAQHFLTNLASSAGAMSFEIIGTAEAITVQIACQEAEADHVEEQLRAYFPDAVISRSREFLANEWNLGGGEVVTVDFGLSQEFMRPLRTFSRFDADPLIGVVGALSNLEPGEIGVLQVLLAGTRSPWALSVLRSVSDWEGKGFFADAPELLAFAQEKVAHQLFATVVRVGTKSLARGRAWQLARRVGGALAQVGNPTSNELIALDNDGYPADLHLDDILQRRTRRSGFLVNSEELVSLVHPPSAVVRTPRLKRDERRTKAAPAVAFGHALVLGENTHGGVSRTVTVAPELRLRHMHVVGASGTGKSTLLLNLIVQDMEQGQGFTLLDPHGDLVDQVLSRVPDDRIDDVILVDPADFEHPVGFNILSAHSELEKTLLSSDLVAVFRRLSTSWGDQMTSVLSNAVLAFLESDRGGTLADLRRFLVEAEFRKEFLQTVQDREVVYYWQKEFSLLTGKPQAPLLTRLDIFLRPRLIRAMVAQPENKLDFAAIMNQGKILLVKLAQGAIGEENAALLGTLFVAKLNQLALGRQATAEQERRPFFVYIDEFQHFVTPSMATLLTGARKYRLGLVLAHQELRQLLNQDRDVAGAVLANPATRVCFRVGDDDAKKLEDGFSGFTARDLQNLGMGQAICRIDRADWDFSLTTSRQPDVDEAVALDRRQRVIGSSRERYSVRPAAVQPERLEVPVQPALATVEVSRRKATRSENEDVVVQEREPNAAPSIEVGRPTSGRGGRQHKYLQELIKRWADANGWRATIEKPILDGLGSVDVALERGAHTIACEVSVASTSDYEVANVQKCLAAGFTDVVSIVIDKRTMNNIRNAVDMEISTVDAERIRILTPENLFEFLDAFGAAPASPDTVRGYKVQVKHRHASDAAVRTRTLTRTIVTALRRLRKRD